jgi:hypothetical protein
MITTRSGESTLIDFPGVGHVAVVCGGGLPLVHWVNLSAGTQTVDIEANSISFGIDEVQVTHGTSSYQLPVPSGGASLAVAYTVTDSTGVVAIAHLVEHLAGGGVCTFEGYGLS